MRMGKNRQQLVLKEQQLVLEGQQLVLEEYQETIPSITVKIETHQDTDREEDLSSLPGCIGLHNQPEQGYVCSSCYNQTLCIATTTPTGALNGRKV